MPTERAGAGGLERAGEHILSGFTSPLSIALTIATFGTAGFLESAGASALTEAGLSAGEVADVAKGAQVMAQATKTGGNYAQAVTNAGLNYNKVKSGLDLLYGAGLKEGDLVGGNLVERGASTLFRHYGLTPAQAQTAAKTLQTAANAGFTYQQIQQAAAMSPRALDALKDGDYDHFAEYATEALAGGLLGAAGASHVIHSAGDLAEPLLGQKLRPSDESRAFSQLFDARDGQHQRADEQARLLEQRAMSDLGYKNPAIPTTLSSTADAQNLRLAQMYHGITLGFDKNLAAEHYNAIAEAAGRPERLPVESPENGQGGAVENPNGTGTQPILGAEASTPGANPALPKNLPELIANSDLKSKPASYVDHILDTYKGVHDGFTDAEMGVMKNLRAQLDQGWEDANANGLMGSRMEDYMQRVWKKANPAANRVINDAKTGRFATNVSMARQRVFQTELEPLLKGYEYATENPVGLTSQWLADTYKTIANRKLLGAVMDRNIKASDGRPAVVMLGNGQVLEGTNGENPATLIRPDSVRNINIAEPVIEQLKSTGDLDRYLDNGTIVDVAPKVYPDTIGKSVDRLQRLAAKSPENGQGLQARIQALQDIQSGKRPLSDLDAINAAQKPIYVWRPQDYIRMDQPSMRKWNFVSHDPSGDPVFLKSDLAVHPEFADYLKTRLGLDESALQKWAPTRLLLKGGAQVKQTILNLSPFHMNQMFLRGVMMGVNPFMRAVPRIEDWTPDLDADVSKATDGQILGKLVDNRLSYAPDWRAIQESSEGVSAGHDLFTKAVSKIPVVGDTMARGLDWYHDWLFKKYIPNLKARAGVEMFEQYHEKHPDWTPDRVAQVAAAHTNSAFGGINWRAMGRSATTQDWAKLLVLAPDWLEATMRNATLPFTGEGGIARKQIALMTMGLWGAARVANLITNGSPHLEAPFGVAVKNKEGRETVYGIRTLPSDMFHLATDPMGFLTGRLSPTIRTAQELISHRDQFGRKLSPGDMGADIFRSMTPIPLQALGQIISQTGPQIGNAGQAAKAAGFAPYVYKTVAQQKAAQIASDHSEDGPVDPTQLHRHRVLMDFEDQVRGGQMSLPQVYQMVVAGQLPEADAKKISENLRMTKGMDPETAAFFTRSSRLPPKDLLSVWDVSTQGEKKAIIPLMRKAQKRYVKQAMTNETPQERLQDSTLKRFLLMSPQSSPF